MTRPAKEAIVGVYMRGPVAWISYAGPGGRTVRETTEQRDVRIAERILKDRRRQVALGTWQPRESRERLTVRVYAERWIARRHESGVLTAHDEETRLHAYVLPHIGTIPLDGARRGDIVAVIDAARRATSDATGKPLAPRTIHHVYGVMRALFSDAVADELVIASPCTLRVKRGELPPKRDADPTWRATAIYSRDEVETIISARGIIPDDRRTLYAIEFLACLRFGEAVGRRWRDLDMSASPLGSLHVATQYVDKPLKTESPRSAPVHPTLAPILAEWKLSGFPALMGRAPRADDWIVPSREGRCRSVRHGHRKMSADMERLGFRPRRQHDTRRTFITLARSDGAPDAPLKAVTHGPGRDIIDDYTTWPWATLCAAVECLRIGRRGAGEVVALTSQSTSHRGMVTANRPTMKGRNERGGRDLNPRQIADRPAMLGDSRRRR